MESTALQVDGTSSPQPVASGPRSWGPVTALVIAVLLIYGRTLTSSFLTWDDDLHITANPALNPLRWSRVAEFWRQPYEDLYIPLSYTVFGLEAAISDLLFPRAIGTPLSSAVVFRSVSVLLHVLCSLCVWRLLRQWVRQDPAALCGALLFTVHPLQVESVAWTSETRGLLAALCSLLALECHLRFRSSLAPRRWQIASLALLLAGLLAKPSAAAVAPMTVVIDRIWLRRSWREVGSSLTPMAALVLGEAWLSSALQTGGTAAASVPLWFRPLVALDAIGWNLVRLVWPHPLAMDYGRTPLLIRTTWGWIWTSAIVLGLAALMLRRHASREWWTAAGLFVAGLLPVCGLVPFAFQEISTVADRYVYLAMLGAALAAAWLWTRLGGVWQKGAVAVALCAFAVQSFFAAGHWHDSDALYAQALRVNPSSWCALHNQAVLRWRRGDADSAVAELQRALQLRPQHANGWHTLGSCLQALDRPADALHALEEAVRHSPGDHRFRLSLARELAAQQRTEESIRNLEESLSIRPNDPGTLTDAGAILSRLNRTQEAIDLFQRAVRIDPSFWQARLNLGLAYDQQQRWGDAAREFGAVLTARPDHSEVRFQRALALAREQHYAMAIREMERVRREASEQNHSQLAEAATQELMIIHNSLGVEALDKNRWDVAEQEFEAAIALHPEFAAGHFNLGRARAGRGATAAARTAYETALSLLPPDSAEARDVAEMLSRLPPSGNTPDVSGEPRKN